MAGQLENISSLRSIGFPWRILLFSVFIFAFAIFVFLGLRLGYGSYLLFRTKTLDKNISDLAKKVSESEQANLSTFYSQLVNLQKVVLSHKFDSNIFSFLEKNVAQGVYYTGAEFSIDGMSLKLKGRGGNLNDIVGQFSIFDQAPEIDVATLDSIGFEGGDTTFNATLKFKESFFEKLD